MAASHRFWPLSIIVIGLIVAGWLAITPSPDFSWAQPSCDERPAYPGCIEIPVNCGPYPDSVCNITKTAVIATRTAAAAPALTQTAQAGGQPSPTASSTPTTTSTAATNTPTSTPTSNPIPTNSPTVVATIQRTLTPTSTPSPTALPTAFLMPSPTISTVQRCAPGDTLELTGTTRPQTALLALFDDRPVGGGASDRSGAFRIVLRIGDERPGMHEIIVRERETATDVATYMCETSPPPTPTPTFGPIRATLPAVP
ncbi:hypothetical protein [Chloroflexus sp.]|uniref:hypothetical protein n=1 Tax=Chloroflexus sp. TaxID=1904827 RepID=UPI0026238D8A|nr:hypothetical protein [uncultured Chloroflexus sp.]